MTHNTRARRRNGGFTLIEILVVVVILGILGMIVVPNIMKAPEKALITQLQGNLGSLEFALNQYKLDKFKYPTTDEGLQILLENKYLPRIPKDPWKNDYVYISPGQHGDFDLYSLGADGASGGEGMNKDIGTWNIDQAGPAEQ
jgi:general secretion pathway protein G